jgi:hypothetical protein
MYAEDKSGALTRGSARDEIAFPQALQIRESSLWDTLSSLIAFSVHKGMFKMIHADEAEIADLQRIIRLNRMQFPITKIGAVLRLSEISNDSQTGPAGSSLVLWAAMCIHV